MWFLKAARGAAGSHVSRAVARTCLVQEHGLRSTRRPSEKHRNLCCARLHRSVSWACACGQEAQEGSAPQGLTFPAVIISRTHVWPGLAADATTHRPGPATALSRQEVPRLPPPAAGDRRQQGGGRARVPGRECPCLLQPQPGGSACGSGDSLWPRDGGLWTLGPFPSLVASLGQCGQGSNWQGRENLSPVCLKAPLS